MKVLKTHHDVTCWKKKLQQEKSHAGHLGFVPTMGGLHEGHLSLVRKSMQENPFTIVSIFLNPTQFNNKADLKSYPGKLQNDLKQLNEIKTNAVFIPSYSDIYPDHYKYIMAENQLSKTLCGKSRKGHFNGVLTIALKLIHIISPHKIYFGEKDYQQLELVKGMIDALFLQVQVVACPTVREASGLAFSSRNQRLSPEGKKHAAEFFKALKSHPTTKEVTKNLEQKNFKIDYIEEREGRRYGAVFYEGVRLIDNVKI